ncbi:MAG: M20/M25/M40 family metallo-hydrolase, partial [Patescibacteria group bacterium]|nr:M20/M25/M40 family metallo-hydrolase [Patescibacteria group bacterium]
MKNTESILKNLVAIQSVFPDEKNVALWTENFLKKNGFEIQKHKIANGRWNILAERGKGKSSLLFYGHMDTVPVYGNWDTNALELVAKGDKLYGVGACDMKGGLAAILNAVASVKTDKKIKILLGVDEENISEGAWKAVLEKKAWFKDVAAILVAEPGASATQTGGINVVTLGRRGRIVFSVEVFGKSAHGAHPKKGINAINEAARLTLALEKIKLQKNPLLGEGTLFVRKFDSQSTSLSIPDYAYLEIDRHIVLPETINSAKSQLEKLIQKLYKTNKLSKNSDGKIIISVKKRKTPYIEPYITKNDNPFVKNILGLIKNNFARDLIINYGKSVADDNIF